MGVLTPLGLPGTPDHPGAFGVVGMGASFAAIVRVPPHRYRAHGGNDRHLCANPATLRHLFCGIHSRCARITPGYCWPTSFQVLGILFLGAVSSAFLPSKKAGWAHQFRSWGGWPTVSARFVDIYGVMVVYLCAADKSPRLTRRPSQEQKGL
jgi:hypothetical protein